MFAAQQHRADSMVDASIHHEHRGNPDGMHSLAKLSKLPIERIRYYSEANTFLIGGIKRGILFVMAFWSGPLVEAFKHITDFLDRLDPNRTLEFVVIDTDGAEDFYEHSEFKGNLHGYGETAWIKDGVIGFTSGRGYNPSCFEPNTRALLDAD